MNILGKGKRQALQTRRSPYRVGQMVCTGCTAKRRARGQAGFVTVVPCRISHGGLLRPGVTCPECHVAWIEAEDQPEAPR